MQNEQNGEHNDEQQGIERSENKTPYQETYQPSTSDNNPSNTNASNTNPGNPTPPVLNEANRLATIALMLAIVSVFIGGILMDAAAIVVCIYGLKKIKSESIMALPQSSWGPTRARLNTALAVSVVAFILNFISMVFVMPMLLQMVQSGDVTQTSAASVAGSGSSIWD